MNETTDRTYEAPTVIEVGNVRELTQGHIFSAGHDNLSWIPVLHFGS